VADRSTLELNLREPLCEGDQRLSSATVEKKPDFEMAATNLDFSHLGPFADRSEAMASGRHLTINGHNFRDLGGWKWPDRF